MTCATLESFKDISNIADAELMDVLWLGKERVSAAFEVESTTQMTEALKRGSGLDAGVKKYMVLPQDREGQLSNKLLSPLFKQAFQDHNWKPIYFEALEETFSRGYRDMKIDTFASIKITKSTPCDKKEPKQLRFFLQEKADRAE